MRDANTQSSASCGANSGDGVDDGHNGYLKLTSFSGAVCDSGDDTNFVETATLTNVCFSGKEYGCNSTHIMKYEYDNDDCSGTARHVSVWNNNLKCQDGYSHKYQCYSSDGEEMVHQQDAPVPNATASNVTKEGMKIPVPGAVKTACTVLETACKAFTSVCSFTA